MGTLAGTGRDKLTLITSPKLASLGVWFEQLLAESTGKAGKGIIPVAREPILSAASYGSDRLFVYVRLDGDANDETDSIVDQVASAGHPVVRMSMSSTSDLGAQFYRWEFATAVAGALMRLNPFDQPNVESAKQLAAAAIQQFERTGEAPKLQSDGSVKALLSSTKPGDYLAIMAYLSATPETDAALQRLRRKVTEQHDITTTLGYGPRFLHSTGQQHKGGPNSGLFLQITADHNPDVAIPGKSFTFGVLADAQADGDYEALREAGRRVARIHLAGGASQLVSAL
jgi:hypothetical protein